MIYWSKNHLCLTKNKEKRLCLNLRLGKGRKSAEDMALNQERSRSRSEERPSHLTVIRDSEGADLQKLNQDLEER